MKAGINPKRYNSCYNKVGEPPVQTLLVKSAPKRKRLLLNRPFLGRVAQTAHKTKPKGKTWASHKLQRVTNFS